MAKFKTTMGLRWENEIVPEFDSHGRPDLLGWDEAMANDVPDFEKWATFHDEEAADACRPVLKGLQEQRAKDYEGIDRDWDHDYPPEFEERLTVKNKKDDPDWKWFYEDFLSIDGFCPDDYGWVNMLDAYDKPYPKGVANDNGKEDDNYDWDYILSTAPSIENFKAMISDNIKLMVEWTFTRCEPLGIETFVEDIERVYQLYRDTYDETWAMYHDEDDYGRGRGRN